MNVPKNGLLGDQLIALGVSRESLQEALDSQESGDRRRVGEILVAIRACDPETLAKALAKQSGLPFITAGELEEGRVVKLFPTAFMENRSMVPIGLKGRSLRVLVADPYDMETIGNIEALGFEVEVAIADPVLISDLIRNRESSQEQESLDSLLGGIDISPPEVAEEMEEDIDHLRDIASEAPVIRLVNRVVSQALDQKASDIHFEPFEDGMVVRYRIDGLLHPVQTIPRRIQSAVTSRIKIMAKLNIAERRLPQDGRIKTGFQDREIDIRVSVVPTIHGESATLRLLDRAAVSLNLDDLGMPPTVLTAYRSLLGKNTGMILVTGPTGSGKTTTLYASLMERNDQTRKIITIEDPVEYLLEGVNQIQVKPSIGLTFASGLRSIVRQDPDIIMVGEMRDPETAKIGVQSAMTGHLVFSTVHTNDAAGAITRLLDMEVEDYLLTTSLLGILAQRLVRKICPHCRKRRTLPASLKNKIGPPGKKLKSEWRGAGCPRCFNTGYSGRTGIFELLILDDTVRKQVLIDPSGPSLRQAAVLQGMVPMLIDGLEKVSKGVTDLEEVLRVTVEDR